VKGVMAGTESDVAILGFFDDNISYTAADNAGTARLHYPTNARIVRVPSTAILSSELILQSLGSGADGIMICEVEESHAAELAEKLVNEVQSKLEEVGLQKERVMFQPMVLPIFKMLPEFITSYTDKIRKLGKIPAEKRVLLTKF
jgi:coenzyme F420-reducing hydrogenase delta subunit